MGQRRDPAGVGSGGYYQADETRRTRTAQTINDLLYHPDPEIHKQAVTELVETRWQGHVVNIRWI